MTNKLREFLNNYDTQKHATGTGTEMHEKLRRIRTLDDCIKVDSELKSCLKSVHGLDVFFTDLAQMEVPIAGIVNGTFISRRIDRLVIDKENKVVRILDYKTDVDKTVFRDKYNRQLSEYAKLIRQIYPDYRMETYILWLHDWMLEKIQTI